VFSLADERSKRRERRLAVLNGDHFTLGLAEQHPGTEQINAERTLSLRRRHELCNTTR